MGLQEENNLAEWRKCGDGGGGEEKKERYELFIIEGAEDLLVPTELNN